jgi:hypothetical protein
LPQDSRSLGVRGARMIASARSDKQQRWWQVFGEDIFTSCINESSL